MTQRVDHMQGMMGSCVVELYVDGVLFLGVVLDDHSDSVPHLRHGRNNNGLRTSSHSETSIIYLYTTKGDACVCVFAKLDQFLPVRSQFDSNQHVNSVRIATFQSANFGPLLFAFYCPLLFYENKIKNE